MLQKIEHTHKDKGFISILYPGTSLSAGDTGIGSIGRIDHAKISGGGFIPMHPHVNDEILSYFRSGKAEHKDSEGFVETIGRERLMLMKAGSSFYHEERMFDDGGEPLEGLQIFIRPGKKDLTPEVHFMDLETLHSENKWRLLASPTTETTFQFSSQTWIYDTKLIRGHTLALPALAKEQLTCLLYVFKGNASIQAENDAVVSLIIKESAVIKDEVITVTANEDTELVLFVTDEQAEIFKGGMYSGNQI